MRSEREGYVNVLSTRVSLETRASDSCSSFVRSLLLLVFAHLFLDLSLLLSFFTHLGVFYEAQTTILASHRVWNWPKSLFSAQRTVHWSKKGGISKNYRWVWMVDGVTLATSMPPSSAKKKKEKTKKVSILKLIFSGIVFHIFWHFRNARLLLWLPRSRIHMRCIWLKTGQTKLIHLIHKMFNGYPRKIHVRHKKRKSESSSLPKSFVSILQSASASFRRCFLFIIFKFWLIWHMPLPTCFMGK